MVCVLSCVGARGLLRVVLSRGWLFGGELGVLSGVLPCDESGLVPCLGLSR